MTIDYRIIGKQIKIARKRKGLTQEFLAEAIERDRSYISYIETGKKKLGLETLLLIANALDVSADELLSFNLLQRRAVSDDLTTLLDNCTPQERKIILETANALKKALQSNSRASSTWRFY